MGETKKHTLEPENWVKNHSDYLYNYTIFRVNNHDLAKDLVQETFYSSLKAMHNFKGAAAERTWLTSILKRKIIDHYRKINSNKGRAEVKMDFVSEDGTTNWLEEKVASKYGNLGERSVENEELNEVLQKCISKLPEKYRDVFILKNIDKLETEEISNALAISSSNIWVIIHRARVQLKKCLNDNWFNN